MNWLTVLQILYYVGLLGGMIFSVHGTWVTRNNHLKHMEADVKEIKETMKVFLSKQEELGERVAKLEGKVCGN